MPRPTVAATTERLYDRLPLHYRDADENIRHTPDYPLLRYLALAVDQASDVEDVARLFISGDAVDPDLADADWLSWLSQLVGMDPEELPRGESARRDAISDASSGWLAGSTLSVREAVRSVLSGTQTVFIYRHHLGDPNKVLVRTRHDETVILTWAGLESAFPDWGDIRAASSWSGLNPNAPLAVIALRGVKPAGVQIFHEYGVSDWDSIEAIGDWDAIEAMGTWNALEDQ